MLQSHSVRRAFSFRISTSIGPIVLRNTTGAPLRGYHYTTLSVHTNTYIRPLLQLANMPKRKTQSTVAEQLDLAQDVAAAAGAEFSHNDAAPPPAKRRASGRKVSANTIGIGSTNPDKNDQVLDAPGAMRASPDAEGPDERMNLEKAGMDTEKQVKDEDDSDSALSDVPEMETPSKPIAKKTAAKAKVAKAADATTPEKAKAKTSDPQDPEADEDVEADEDEIKEASRRPPPVNSDYLPLPWKGRLGYVSIHEDKCIGPVLTSTRPA